MHLIDRDALMEKLRGIPATTHTMLSVLALIANAPVVELPEGRAECLDKKHEHSDGLMR